MARPISWRQTLANEKNSKPTSCYELSCPLYGTQLFSDFASSWRLWILCLGYPTKFEHLWNRTYCISSTNGEFNKIGSALPRRALTLLLLFCQCNLPFSHRLPNEKQVLVKSVPSGSRLEALSQVFSEAGYPSHLILNKRVPFSDNLQSHTSCWSFITSLLINR